MNVPRFAKYSGVLLLLAFCAGLVLVPSTHAQDSSPPDWWDPATDRSAEILSACKKKGLKDLRTVGRTGKTDYRVECAASDQGAAQQVVAEVLATPAPGQTPVRTLQDALVVLRFEPRNTKANELVRKRYEELRQAHIKSLKKDE